MVDDRLPQELRLASSKFLISLLMIMITVAVVMYAAVADLTSVSYVTYDSMSYRDQAVGYCAAPYQPVLGAAEQRDLVGFNWTTIVTIGAVLCSLDEGMLDISVLMLNLGIMLVTLSFYRRSVDLLRLDMPRIALFATMYFLQFYHLTAAVYLNKEVYGFLAVSLYLYLALRSRPWLLLFAACVFALVKIQFLMLGVYLFFLVLGVKNRYMLVAMSIVLSLIYQVADPSFFNLDVYYARFDYQITTEAATRLLNEIVAYPFGYLLVLPARFLITIAAGLNPLGVDAGSPISVAYYVSSLLFCCLTLFMFYRVLVSRVPFDNFLFKFVIAYIAVMGMVPFIQLRYFLPLTPVIVLLLISCRFPRQMRFMPASSAHAMADPAR